ncbi:MAG: response regulator [Candidatus Ornithomonoglobus sp.]
MLIMLVENNADELRKLQSFVAECYPNSDIMPFSDSGKAMDCIRSDKFLIDMCFTDIVMPGSSGFEIVKELLKHNKQARLVFMSDTPDYAADAWRYYVKDYLLKPITTESVQRTLRS